MAVPVHIGIEHPNLLWIVGVGFLTFLAGLGVNLYRSVDGEALDRGGTPDDGRIE